MAHNPDPAPGQPTGAAGSGDLSHVRYEDVLRALGNYIDRNGFTDVVITQIPDGVLLKGTIIENSPGGPRERVGAVLFTEEDILKLLQDSAQHRRGSANPQPGTA